ncbi:phosphatase and actin regulator 2 [Trichonephila clavipes]|nr:phosphatase and actin regulator 2 [Trichonephila clavipes]
MYKNALKEDLIRVVEDLDGTVESTDTIAKLNTKIEKSSTFESDADFVKTLIKNSIDERETATLIGIREAEDWFRPIDLAKECDIYISSRSGSHKETPIACGYTEDPFKNRPRNYKPKIKDNYPQYLERHNKNCYICGDSSHYTRDCERCFKPKESNSHIHNRKNANTLKVKSEKQKSDEFAQLQYVNIFVENQPVTALIDSGCHIPVLHSSLIRVNKPSEGIITLSSCFNEERMVNDQIDYWLQQGIIRESCSDYCSPIVLCKKVNGALKTSSVGSNSRSPTPSPMEALEVETEEKERSFEQTSRTLERKISMRSTKEELIKKGVLMPDGTDKDQDSKINDSVHQNHIPQINGFGPESGMSETEKQHKTPSVTYTSSSVLETYNTFVVTNSGFLQCYRHLRIIPCL